MKFTSFKDDLHDRLRADPAYAVEYLRASLEDNVHEFRFALREVSAAHLTDELYAEDRAYLEQEKAKRADAAKLAAGGEVPRAPRHDGVGADSN